MNFNWKNLSKKELENNYNPRKAVADFSKYILEYKTLGQKSRKELHLYTRRKLWRHSITKT